MRPSPLNFDTHTKGNPKMARVKAAEITEEQFKAYADDAARLIVDKAKGVISFEPKDEIFVVRFVLPNTVK